MKRRARRRARHSTKAAPRSYTRGACMCRSVKIESTPLRSAAGGHVEEALKRRVVDGEARPRAEKEVGAEEIDIRKLTVRDAHGDFDAVDEDVRRGRHAGVDEVDCVKCVLAKERARRACVDEEKDVQGHTTRVTHRERNKDTPVDAVDDTTCREPCVRWGGEREVLEPEVVASKVREVTLADIRDDDVEGGGLHRGGLHRSTVWRRLCRYY